MKKENDYNKKATYKIKYSYSNETKNYFKSIKNQINFYLNDADAYIRKGSNYYDMKYYRDAFQYFNKAIQLDSKKKRAHEYKEYCLKALENENLPKQISDVQKPNENSKQLKKINFRFKFLNPILNKITKQENLNKNDENKKVKTNEKLNESIEFDIEKNKSEIISELDQTLESFNKILETSNLDLGNKIENFNETIESTTEKKIILDKSKLNQIKKSNKTSDLEKKTDAFKNLSGIGFKILKLFFNEESKAK